MGAHTCPRRDAMDGRSARRRRKNLPGSSFAFCPLFCFRRTFLVLLLLFLPSPFRFAFLFSFALAPSSSSSSPPSLLRPVPFLPSSFPPSSPSSLLLLFLAFAFLFSFSSLFSLFLVPSLLRFFRGLVVSSIFWALRGRERRRYAAGDAKCPPQAKTGCGCPRLPEYPRRHAHCRHAK